MADTHHSQQAGQEVLDRIAIRVATARKAAKLPRRVLSEMSGVSPRYLASNLAGSGRSLTHMVGLYRPLSNQHVRLVAQCLTNKKLQLAGLVSTCGQPRTIVPFDEQFGTAEQFAQARHGLDRRGLVAQLGAWKGVEIKTHRSICTGHMWAFAEFVERETDRERPKPPMPCCHDIMQKMHYMYSMDIDLFRDLERLQQTGNFSQAASLRNLSQPALSRRIQSLESWVGVALVDRSRQPVRLTEAGLQMLEAGLQAVARIEQERSQILEAQSLPDKYMVTFGAQHSIGWRFFPSWLQALEDAYGPILSRLRADDLPNCMRDLASGDVDFVIAYNQAGDTPASVEDSVVIGEDQLVPVCKPDGAGAPVFNFDSGTVEMPYLRFGDNAPISSHIEPLLVAQQLKPRLRTVYENSMAGALRIRARAGDGIAWLPKSLVAPDLENGLLVLTGESDWTVQLEIRVFRHPKHANRITRSIWSFLEVRQDVPLFSSPHDRSKQASEAAPNLRENE